MRVWYASDNRSDGDASAAEKLIYSNDGNDSKFDRLKDSAIQHSQLQDWKMCSAKDSGAVWSSERALDFQKAVEKRCLDLYERYVNELEFQVWFNV